MDPLHLRIDGFIVPIKPYISNVSRLIEKLLYKLDKLLILGFINPVIL
jgi:hypothetical protein